MRNRFCSRVTRGNQSAVCQCADACCAHLSVNTSSKVQSVLRLSCHVRGEDVASSNFKWRKRNTKKIRKPRPNGRRRPDSAEVVERLPRVSVTSSHSRWDKEEESRWLQEITASRIVGTLMSEKTGSWNRQLDNTRKKERRAGHLVKIGVFRLSKCSWQAKKYEKKTTEWLEASRLMQQLVSELFRHRTG